MRVFLPALQDALLLTSEAQELLRLCRDVTAALVPYVSSKKKVTTVRDAPVKRAVRTARSRNKVVDAWLADEAGPSEGFGRDAFADLEDFIAPMDEEIVYDSEG